LPLRELPPYCSGAGFRVVQHAVFRISFVAEKPRRFPSSAKVIRAFCPDWGIPLTYQHADLPKELDISTCSLVTPETVRPDDHTHTAEQLPWIHFAAGLETYPGSKPT
jgi:hypothetical protein